MGEAQNLLESNCRGKIARVKCKIVDSRNGKSGGTPDILTGELAGIGSNGLEAKGKEGPREASKGSGM